MPREVQVKSVLNKAKKRDDWFLADYSFNPYSGCAFNCLYCYVRGSKYGHNMETSLSVKTNSVELLDKQLALRARKNQYGFIMFSSATDPYVQIEKDYKLTRRALEVILKYRFPVHMLTKSGLIERDFDLLHEINRAAILPDELTTMKRGAIIGFSFSTVKDEIAHIFEPGAPPPSQRLRVVEKTLKQGFLTGISLMPLLPYISDTTEQLHLTFSTFRKLGVHYVLPSTITLFGEERADSKTLMINALKKHYPHLVEKYNRFFAHSTSMPGYYQKAFYSKMEELCKEYGLKSNILKATANC